MEGNPFRFFSCRPDQFDPISKVEDIGTFETILRDAPFAKSGKTLAFSRDPKFDP
jgi:hypothetical protein